MAVGNEDSLDFGVADLRQQLLGLGGGVNDDPFTSAGVDDDVPVVVVWPHVDLNDLDFSVVVQRHVFVSLYYSGRILPEVETHGKDRCQRAPRPRVKRPRVKRLLGV